MVWAPIIYNDDIYCIESRREIQRCARTSPIPPQASRLAGSLVRSQCATQDTRAVPLVTATASTFCNKQLTALGAVHQMQQSKTPSTVSMQTARATAANYSLHRCKLRAPQMQKVHSTDANCAHHKCKRFAPQMQSRSPNATICKNRCRVLLYVTVLCVCKLFTPQMQNWLLHRCSTVQCRPLHRLTPVCHPAALLLILPLCSRTNALSWSPDASPYSLGLSSSAGSGGCSSCALL